MPKKKSDKKIECFSASFNDILICQKDSDRPYIEAFVEEPENITQQNLGTLAGILEITDSSEDSSYIVNYLISVIKKEYYSRPKRGTIESFESALRKANLALAKLAEHETIGWIGHTNAILIVVDKNNLHLAQSGSARALLLRGKILTDLSDGGISETPNPIKTFTDIVSGRLEENDKLIITTDVMFDLFSMEEIKKSALKFPSPDFLRFLKTALINELPRAAALVIEMRKEEKAIISQPEGNDEFAFNAFSQKSFAKKVPSKGSPVKNTPSESFYSGQSEDQIEISSERRAMVKEIKDELEKNKTEFVDKKTGHIYIKENRFGEEPDPSLWENIDIWKEKLSNLSSAAIDFGKSFGQKIKDMKKPEIPALKNIRSEKNIPLPENPKTAFSNQEKHIPIKKIPAETKLQEAENRLVFYWKEHAPRVGNFCREHLKKVVRVSRQIALRTWEHVRLFLGRAKEEWAKRQERKVREASQINRTEKIEKPSGSRPENDWMKKYSEKLSGTSSFVSDRPMETLKERRPATDLKKFLPQFSRLRNILGNLDYTQKIYVAGAIVLLFIVPYFLAKIGNKTVPQNEPSEQTETVPAVPLAQDKNIVHVEKVESVYSGQNISDIINLNGSFYAISAQGITELGNNNVTYPLPDNFQPGYSAGMDDLGLIFLLGQDQQLFAWSSNNKKFQSNSIAFPDGSTIIGIETYLTYLYVLDAASGQIWRYPRAEAGFGERSDWIKNPSDTSDTKTMAVSDNIYLSDGKSVLKLFQGNKQDFALSETATQIQIESLYAKRDFQNLYLLDKINGRVIKTDFEGHILSQYENPEIKNATDLAVDEEGNMAYIASPNNVGKFQIK